MRNRYFYLLGAVSVSAVISAQAAAQDQTTVLDTIVITGDKQGDTSRDSYLANQPRSATKTATAVDQAPQSITTVTRKQLDDQNPQTVQSALNYTAGVLASTDENSRFDSLSIRGFGGFFSAMRIADYLDGMRLVRGQAWGIPQIDPFLLDRVEVLKGPTGVLYGQISPGGLINQISRMPSAEPYNEVRIEGGSHGRVQSGVTSQGKLDPDGIWQYSLSAVGRSSGSRYDDVNEKRFAVAPALTWQPDQDTKLTVLGYYEKDPEAGYFNHIYPDFLAPSAYSKYLGRYLNVGDPNYDGYEREQFGVGYIFEHRFNDNVKIGSRLRYGGLDSEFRVLQMAGPLTNDGLIPRWGARAVESAYGLTTDNNIQLDFSTGPVTHTVLGGIDFQRTTSDFKFDLGTAQPLDVTTPQYGFPVGPFATATDNHQKMQQLGFYLQDQISLGNLHALLGVRHDWTDNELNNRLTNSTQKQSPRKASYRAGLLYQFDNGLAPYASYSTSFEPVTGVDASGSSFVPTEASQFEVGVKYRPSFMDALFTLSVFDIKQKNVLTPGPITGFNVQQGEVRSRGLELESRGNITANLELIGAFTMLNTEIAASNISPSIIGNRPQGIPDYFGSLWANYNFDAGALNGLTVGGGLRFVGASYADDANKVRAPAYTLVDVALRYDLGAANAALKGAEATLNVTNLLDKEYYSGCSNGFYCQVGNGRTVRAGLHYRW